MSLDISISFIIPTYNSAKTIQQCLESIIHESRNFNSEILVIDDCSKDETEKIVKIFEEVKFYKLKKNGGVGRARSIGCRLALNKILCYVDSDLIISKNSVNNLIQKLISDSKIGSVGGIPDPITLNKDSWSSKFVGLRSSFGFEDINYEVEVSDAQSEFFVIYNTFLRKIGGWKYYRNAGGEEYELGHRINLFNKKNLKLKNVTYKTYWSKLFDRFKKNIDRTEKYIPMFLKRKKFDSEGSGASLNQAFSALLTSIMFLNTILFFIISNNKNLFISILIFFLLQIFLEYKFLTYAKKVHGLKMLFYSIYGIQILNIGILFGGLFFLYNVANKIYKKIF